MEPRGKKEGCYAGPIRLRLSRAKVSTLTGEANGKVCLGSLLDSCLLTGSTEQRRGGVGWGGQLGPLTESAGTFAGKGPSSPVPYVLSLSIHRIKPNYLACLLWFPSSPPKDSPLVE